MRSLLSFPFRIIQVVLRRVEEYSRLSDIPIHDLGQPELWRLSVDLLGIFLPQALPLLFLLIGLNQEPVGLERSRFAVQ